MTERNKIRKRAKTKNGSAEGKVERVSFRVYPHEKEKILRLANELGLSIGDVMMLPFAADIRIRDGSTQGPLGADEARRNGVEEVVVFTVDEYLAVANAVNRYGHNLNQAAKALNKIASSNHMSDFSVSLALNDVKHLLDVVAGESRHLSEISDEVRSIEPFRSEESNKNRKRKRAERGEDGDENGDA